MYQVFDTGAYSRGQCHTMPQPKTEKILLEIFYEAKIQKQILFNSSETSFEIYLNLKTVFKMEKVFFLHLIVVLRWLGHVTIPHKVSLHGHVLHLRQWSPFIQIFLCRAAQFSPGHKLIQGGSQCPSPPSHLLVPHHILERYR